QAERRQDRGPQGPARGRRGAPAKARPGQESRHPGQERMTMKRIALVALLVAGLAAAPPKEAPPAEALPKAGPVTPPPREALDSAIRRGLGFLLKDQNPDGSWGTAERTKGLNIYAPVPGAHHAFRTAVTALCVSALIEAAGDVPEARRAVE